MSNVVVTGGAGFIGSHLVDRLLADGHRVTAIDNTSVGRWENLSDVKDSPSLQTHQVDVSDHEAIKPLFAGADRVFHLAARADIVPSIQHPMEYHRSNVDGTISVLEASREARVKRFVYAASSSCYGIPDVFPTPETAPIRTMYPYALTKYLGEQYAMHWDQVYDMPCVSLRFFNVYGPRARTSGTYGAVFGVFLAQKLAGKPFTVVGDGTQTRDFTFVSDVVESLVRASESDVRREIFNVGSGGTYTINRLVSILGGDVVHLPKRPGEPDCTFADTTNITQALDWQPKVGFEEGVQVMVDNIESWREAPVWDTASITDATKDWFNYLGGKPAANQNAS
ncbi:MAG: SDR family oxidoreductase [SAR202 cluster bacterium]|nr:SDR family oxidoreductase [SAR202 cluster bacterium]